MTFFWLLFVWSLLASVASALLCAAGLVPPAAAGIAALLALAIVLRWRAAIANAIPAHAGWGMGLVVAAAVARLAGLTAFILDSAHAEASVLWFDPFYVRHNCFTAVWYAARRAWLHVPNIYDSAAFDNFLGRFPMDDFLYASPALLVPRTFIAFSHSFFTARMAWFAVELATFVIALAVTGRWLGGETGKRFLFAAPALLAATPILLTLQIGNFQLFALALSLLAFVAFDTHHEAAGGAALGFALFKIFPAMLVVALAFQRRWRAVIWTGAWAAIYTAISVVWMGVGPLRSFFTYRLPTLVNGSAWDFLEIPAIVKVIGINQSIPGIALKLQQLGVVANGHHLIRTMSTAYSVVLLAVAGWIGTRLGDGDRLRRAQLWIALFALAALRSPFTPDAYGLTPALCLWALLVPELWGRRHAVVAAIALWIPLTLVLPWETPLAPEGSLRIWLGLAIQFISIALATAIVVRPLRATTPALDLMTEPA